MRARGWMGSYPPVKENVRMGEMGWGSERVTQTFIPPRGEASPHLGVARGHGLPVPQQIREGLPSFPPARRR